MTITKRLSKGSALTHLEMDANFDALLNLSTSLTSSSGSASVGFLQSGDSPASRTAQGKMRDIVDARDFLPSGFAADASTDYTTELGRFLIECQGRSGRLPKGRFLHTGLTIAKCMSLEGEASDLLDASTTVSSLVYSGTGAGVTVEVSGSKIFNPSIRNIRLEATGSATTNANAIGLKLINCNYGVFHNVSIKGFTGGVGILATATSGLIGASNSFFGCTLYNNLVGYKFDGVAAEYGDFASTIHGGVVIGVGTGTAGCKGLWVTQYAHDVTVFGVDFETAEYLVDLYGNGDTNGGSVKLIGCRTEFHGTKHIRINTGTRRTQLIGHRFYGGAASTWVEDSGTLTQRHDPDSNVRVNNLDLTLANNIPIYGEDTGGTQRQVLKYANNDTVQIGSAAHGNFPIGTWNFSGKLYPSTAALASQSSAALLAGSGAPSDANGADGDFYFRSDGTKAGNTVIYHKEGGSWVALGTS